MVKHFFSFSGPAGSNLILRCKIVVCRWHSSVMVILNLKMIKEMTWKDRQINCHVALPKKEKIKLYGIAQPSWSCFSPTLPCRVFSDWLKRTLTKSIKCSFCFSLKLWNRNDWLSHEDFQVQLIYLQKSYKWVQSRIKAICVIFCML